METSNKSKVGLFFGSFNPIHIGHLALANYFYSFSPLEEVWFIVSPQNPLKQSGSLLSDTERLKMVRLATADFAGFRVSDVEFHLPKPSYTIDTLKHLRQEFPQHEFVLIIGEDNLHSFQRWKDYDKILNEYSIYVYNRPGTTTFSSIDSSHVTFYKAPLLDISSTFIRESLKAGKNVRFFLPEKVFHYIEERHLYGYQDGSIV